MERQLDATAGKMLQKSLEIAVCISCGEKFAGYPRRPKRMEARRVKALRFSDGSEVPAQLDRDGGRHSPQYGTG